ncbi:hypothetical protein [Tropicimonas sediminicola]|uniref:Tetratricopeptide repeat-like domain-containing protein n=1 Tax=Tropicimonas sediminicola TaxID=1031541 RepID=A0A239HNH8_9RHOB|nr:hypothetical protein [Tropicimonas sediminicola]SNS81804.1 hypothetical protein SAMN05421757_103466 [Tropicimonas sediminicola]
MSQADSFIDEVNEAVRRDKLYRTLRRYGWIGVLLVVVIVGGAAWNEYSKASKASQAQALGDTLMTELQKPEAADRIAGLETVQAEGDLKALVDLLTAAELLGQEDPEAAAEVLRPVAADPALPAVYGDLAAYKMLLLGDAAFDETERAQVLDRLAQPGAPYRNLAMEQKALDLAAAGDTEAALAAARALLEEPGLTQSLFQRVNQLIVTLGEEPGDANG